MRYSSVSKRVERGMALLDKKFHSGWRHQIDVERLDMQSHEDGLLEQLAHTWVNGLVILDLGTQDAASYGFDIARDAGDKENRRQWSELTEEWKKQLGQETKEKEVCV